METQEPDLLEKAKAEHHKGRKHRGLSSCSGRHYCIIFSFVFLVLTLLSAAILLILFVLKPKKPIFHLHSIQLDAFKLNVSSSTKEVFVSCSAAPLLFITQNPNKLGISYSPSELGILYENIPVGTLDVPKFYQPAHSKNVTVIMYVSIQQFNLSRLINGTHAEVQITGGIGVQGHILNFPLPRIKVPPLELMSSFNVCKWGCSYWCAGDCAGFSWLQDRLWL